MALRNVDKVIADNEVAVKDTLRNFESFTASLSGNGEKITSIIATAEDGITAVDGALDKTKDFLGGLASDKYGGELLPTVISMRELIESFDKKSGQLSSPTPARCSASSASPINKPSQNSARPACPARQR